MTTKPFILTSTNNAYFDINYVSSLPDALKNSGRLLSVRIMAVTDPEQYNLVFMPLDNMFKQYERDIQLYINQNLENIIFAENADGSGRDLTYRRGDYHLVPV